MSAVDAPAAVPESRRGDGALGVIPPSWTQALLMSRYQFRDKTGYYLMGLPIKRWSVYAGKYLAAFAASLVTITVYFIVLLFVGAYFVGGGAISAGVFESLALVALYLAAVLGTTFLFSSLFKTSMYGVIIVAIMFLFGFSLVEGLIVGLAQTTPWFIITWASSSLSYPITGLPATAGIATRGIVTDPTFAQGIGVMLGYFFGTTLGGLALFAREEFT
jgi:ABC-type transport system involved in multi-copper enzyme maturation permease subunit